MSSGSLLINFTTVRNSVKSSYSIELKLPPVCKGGIYQCAFLLTSLVADNKGARLLMQSEYDIFQQEEPMDGMSPTFC